MALEERRQSEIKKLREKYSRRVINIFTSRQAVFKGYMKSFSKAMHPNSVCTVCHTRGINNQLKTCWDSACKTIKKGTL